MARRPTKTSKAKSGSKTKAKAKPKPKEPLLSGVSPQRRVDIFAVIFLLIGTLTLISLLTQTNGSVTGWWVKNLSLVMGWGVYILPLALIIIGAWMLFRNVEHLPRLSPDRTVGITLFFVNLTAWFHLIIDGGFPQAALGTGGGYIGSAIKLGLVRTLGKPGAIVALIAWLLISLILTLDLVMANILKWFGVLCKSLGQQIQGVVARMHTRLRTRREVRNQTTKAEEAPTPAVASPQQDLPAKRTAETAADMDRQYTDTLPAEPVWVLPDPHEILDPAVEPPDDAENDRHRARVIEETLRSFGAPAHVVEIHRGPTVTLFGVEPDFIASRNGKTRVRVSKITALSDDLALALAAARIRIQAPVPGKGYIGIEVPNRHIALVSLQEVMDSPAFNNMSSPLKIAMGKDVSGNPVAADLTAMPHLLIAGTTGAGKSVCINDILTCFLLNKTPDELRLVLVDPKRVELTGYNGIPHLLSPVIVDAEHVVGALQWMMREMDNRYRKFSETHTRNIADYNLHCEQTHEKKLPFLLVVIDELSDLMMLAPDETERAITRLAQLARATGIHLIIATQRPSTDILTGLIKANFPARIAFAVASSVDSRVILDHPGAERLLGRGDMLFQAPDAPAPIRIQSAYVSDAEINRLTAYWRGFTVSDHAPERPDQSAAFHSNRGVALKQVPLWEEVEDQDLDPKYEQALEVIREEGQASVSMLQRKMRIGYTRAARLIDKLQEKGIISEPDPKTQIRSILESGQDD
jgi:DNA segregation ATPase FtsK/SpoIIIE, S-DNA-T family